MARNSKINVNFLMEKYSHHIYNKQIDMVGIYKILNPKGKIYIGQSVNIEKRKYYYQTLHCQKQIMLYNSLKKYGWENHHFEVIEECSVEQLDVREMYWGQFYNTLEDGLNLRLGKGGGLMSEKTKNKIGKTNSRPKPKNFNSKLKKPILQFNLEGELIKEYSSLTEATKILDFRIHEVLRGVTKTAGGFIFIYKEKWDGSKPNITPDKHSIPILQLDLKGNIIKEWESTSQAHKELNLTSILNCLKERTKTAGGFKWKYKN
jgi:group I intron endonuclease